ncbi:MAG: hypothetical protein BLM47_11215 [Candidatus Reconcilbacillus cellulovorans]|uniref:Cell division protein FtsI n=1 Tax=Candidatus Reconcilbacillus cellulovorans TaxID=1906605 RepID=A0A2A6DXQ2_9BACL|nr:MAG: hypothetical protein BLM47_11215 [Candidatus Reconcilbacillus cellulovorans]
MNAPHPPYPSYPEANVDDRELEEMLRRRRLTFRLNVFFFATFLLFSVLVVRLASVQFVEGESLAALEERQENKPVVIPPVRGNIYTADEVPVAYSESTMSVFYYLDMNRKAEDYIALARKLERVFSSYGDRPMTAAEIMEKMDTRYDINGRPRVIRTPAHVPRQIKSDLTKREIAYLAEHRNEFPGISVEEESMRRYNDQRIAVQLVGYLRRYDAVEQTAGTADYYRRQVENGAEYSYKELVGFDGLELKYQEELRGKPGRKSYPVNAMGEIVGPMSIVPPEKGKNLILTIHSEVQLEAQRAIREHLEKIRNSTNPRERAENAQIGFAVAIETRTGYVRAMASFPDYDPNIWRTGSVTQEVWDANKHAMSNGTIRTVYPNYKSQEDRNKHPGSMVYIGSAIKPLSVLFGLKEKYFTPNSRYFDTGTYTYGRDNTTVSNADGKALGWIDPATAIAKSSNVFMMGMVSEPMYRRGKEALEAYMAFANQFGLGVLTGGDGPSLPNEITGTTMADLEKEIRASSLQNVIMRITWGQMTQFTTLQLAQYALTLANRGKRLKPQFVERMTTYDFEPVETFEPVVLNEVKLPDEYWNVVHDGMLRVFKTGFDGVSYSVAAKTGTSTMWTSAGEVNNAVFIAYAPADNPKLAVAVVVPEGGYGAWGAAPIARRIFDAYDRAYGLDDAG